MQQTLDFCSNCHQWYCQPPPISTMTPIRLRSEFTPRRLSLSDSNVAAVHCKAGKGARRLKHVLHLHRCFALNVLLQAALAP